MSLVKAIEHGKEHRKYKYNRCYSWRRHKVYCDYCLANDLYSSVKKGLCTRSGNRKKFKVLIKFYGYLIDIKDL